MTDKTTALKLVDLLMLERQRVDKRKGKTDGRWLPTGIPITARACEQVGISRAEFETLKEFLLLDARRARVETRQGGKAVVIMRHSYANQFMHEMTAMQLKERVKAIKLKAKGQLPHPTGS